MRQISYLPELLILNVNRYNNPFTDLDRPVGLQEVEASRIFGQSAHEGGRVVSCTHRPHLPRRGYLLVLIFVRGWLDPRAIVRLEGLCHSNPRPSGL